eukprot:CAMPEP_0194055840 /NCGR_PEP_ID=MMETSP0009_2-20130614/58117_1 /TAXON_ID=210454 /ORGANISM="Grammatophora oceanica, Strain CCMP 410" /LENGTH=37 /DNA_ID= /DNA_START= /DNA_END= /DNA_ORIENTATION=
MAKRKRATNNNPRDADTTTQEAHVLIPKLRFQLPRSV